MVRIPSFARRPDTAGAATEDRNRDGQIDERDERSAADTRTIDREQVDDRGPRDSANPATGVATVPAEVDARREQAGPRADADQIAAENERDRTDDRTDDRTEVVERAPVGPRPRASLLATLGLVFGVASAMLVLTGLLAGYGVAVGVVGLLLSIGGMSATGKRHVAGKSDALLGIVLNIGAIVLGALALTGALPWLTTETDKVDQLRQWLDTQFANRF